LSYQEIGSREEWEGVWSIPWRWRLSLGIKVKKR